MQSRGRSEESRGKNVPSVLQHYNTTTADWLCWKRVKPEKQCCVGYQGWKVLWWMGWEDGEGGQRRERGAGKAGKRERVVDIGERSGAFPRTVGPRCGVECPTLISARFGSGFSSNPVLLKPLREVGG